MADTSRPDHAGDPQAAGAVVRANQATEAAIDAHSVSTDPLAPPAQAGPTPDDHARDCVAKDIEGKGEGECGPSS